MPEIHQVLANQPPLGCLLQRFWFAIGSAVLLLIGTQFVQFARQLSGLDVAYKLIVLLIGGARLAEIRYFATTDGFGTPPTLSDGTRYVINVTLLLGLI